MTREEKIEVMFESLLSDMEEVRKKMDKMDHGKAGAGGSALEQKLDEFMAAVLDIRIPVHKPDYGPILKRLDGIAAKLDSLRSSVVGTDQGKKWPFHPFIPGLLAILLAGSLLLNIFLIME